MITFNKKAPLFLIYFMTLILSVSCNNKKEPDSKNISNESNENEEEWISLFNGKDLDMYL